MSTNTQSRNSVDDDLMRPEEIPKKHVGNKIEKVIDSSSTFVKNLYSSFYKKKVLGRKQTERGELQQNNSSSNASSNSPRDNTLEKVQKAN